LERIALLSDVHANLPALRAVLDEVARDGIGRIAWLGDVVGYGAHPRECVEVARAHGGVAVRGNHDWYALQLAGAGSRGLGPGWEQNPVWAGVVHAAEQLAEEDWDWLVELPLVAELPGAVLAHAALHDAGDWPYLLDAGRAALTWEVMRRRGRSLGFFGHTHRQRWFADRRAPGYPQERGEGRLWIPEHALCTVVVGSVGQPRDGDSRASWAVWDPAAREVEFRRTGYPALEAARAILAAGLPLHSALRLLDAREARELLADPGGRQG
jgi:predicted phosphodiesterase